MEEMRPGLEQSPAVSRDRQPSMMMLQMAYEDATSTIDDLLLTNPSEMSTEGEALSHYITSLKVAMKTLTGASRAFSSRLSAMGSLNEAHEVRERRINCRKDVQEIITAVNVSKREFGEDIFSNIDSSSVVSSVNDNQSDVSMPSAHYRTAEYVFGSSKPETSNIMKESIRPPFSFKSQDVPMFASNLQPPSGQAQVLLSQSLPKSSAQLNYSSLDQPLTHTISTPMTHSRVTVPAFPPCGGGFNFNSVKTPIPTISSSERTQFRPNSAVTNTRTVHFKPSPTVTYTYSSPYTPHSFPHTTTASQPANHNVQTNYQPSSTNSISKELIVKDILKKSIEPFDGTSYNFWSWVGQIEGRLEGVALSPLQTMQFLESHCVAEPQKMIRNHIASAGRITDYDVQELWSDLCERYGSAHLVAEQLLAKLEKFPVIRGIQQGKQLTQLYDLCKIIQFNIPKCAELQILNIAKGSELVRNKLPVDLQTEWRKYGQQYEEQCGPGHPPFSVLLQFLKAQGRALSNSNYIPSQSISQASHRKVSSHVMQTTEVNSNSDTAEYCQYHDNDNHSFQNCRAFHNLSYKDRKIWAFNKKLCFNCLQGHQAADCKTTAKCNICSGRHITVMHRDSFKRDGMDVKGQQFSSAGKSNLQKTLCTHLCGNENVAKNCSKTVLVELSMKDVPSKKLICYAIIDEQSNVCLVDESVPSFFEKSFPTRPVTLNFASDKYQVTTQEQIVTGLLVRGVKEKQRFLIPEALTSDGITDTTDEVATPNIVRAHPHIAQYASNFASSNPDAKVLLLIGRNCGQAMATKCYGHREPYAHKTPLGWALVGSTCVTSGRHNIQNRVLKTNLRETVEVKSLFPPAPPDIMKSPFDLRSDDEQPGLSQEDEKFLSIMKQEFTVTSEGSIQLPLPMKELVLPNNKNAVYNRSVTVLNRLKQNKTKWEACRDAIDKGLKAEYIEEVPQKDVPPENGNVWWLPIFPVEHPRKKKIRLVYDAAAKYKGTCINDVLLQGPNLMNQLRGILLRFRERDIAYVCDIEAMFNCFKIPIEQRDLHRFFWFGENDASKPVTEYRCTTHIFGARSSPAIANYGLKLTATHPTIQDNTKVKDFVTKSFYVDDGVSCSDSPEEAINVLKDTKDVLASYNIRLHKFMSNSATVLNAFAETEVSNNGIFSLNFEDIPMHSTLGVTWDPTEDCLIVQTGKSDRPFTKRGVLSMINSLYDPLGIVSPVTLAGRLIQRAVIPPKKDSTSDLEIGWDDPLPQRFHVMWQEWRESLHYLPNIKVPRCYKPVNCNVTEQQLHIFADASEAAIGHVVYWRTIDNEGDVHVSFVHGESKVAPRGATTIPRLELCAAVDASLCSTKIIHDLENKPSDVTFYSDSKIVLSYIANQQKRFSNYVSRRISTILKNSTESQWKYVPTKDNPGDIASRGCHPTNLSASIWFTGPKFLWQPDFKPPDINVIDSLPEEREEKLILKTTERERQLTPLSKMSEQRYDLTRIINVTKYILKFLNLLDQAKQRLGIPLAARNPIVNEQDSIVYLIKDAQQSFNDVIHILSRSQQLPESHKLCNLSPFLDCNGLIRVGGRLSNSTLAFDKKHPALLPENHGLTQCLLYYYHQKGCHQGRHITHAIFRQAGYHLLNGRRVLRNFLKNCFICQKLRGRPLAQQMATLPKDRLEETPPFLNTGMDAFGPFKVHDGVSTRRSPALKKTWVLIFVCLCSRAVHLEMLPAMDVSSFRNAFSRFICIRGHCELIRSDRGSNFTCAQKQMTENLQQKEIAEVLIANQCKWEFNPPGASHFGGCYERKIGSIRRVLEGALATMGPRNLSRDELSTLLQEAASVVNNTPLWDVSYSPEEPFPLTPANLLTLRDSSRSANNDQFSDNDLLSYGQRRWRRCQYLAQQFWTRWRTEYLHTLQKRHKWTTKKPCAAVGDIVLLRDKMQKRNSWPVGVIEGVKKSSDNLIRSVDVRLAPLTYGGTPRHTTRSITDLILLAPVSSHSC